jgi:hypothetical protein
MTETAWEKQFNNLEEVTEAERAQLIIDAPIYHKLAQEKITLSASENLRRTLGNIVNFLSPLFNPVEEDGKTCRLMINAVNALKKYLELLRKYPEFAERELAPGAGYFPLEKVQQIEGGDSGHVDAFEQWLIAEYGVRE